MERHTIASQSAQREICRSCQRAIWVDFGVNRCILCLRENATNEEKIAVAQLILQRNIEALGQGQVIEASAFLLGRRQDPQDVPAANDRLHEARNALITASQISRWGLEILNAKA